MFKIEPGALYRKYDGTVVQAICVAELEYIGPIVVYRDNYDKIHAMLESVWNEPYIDSYKRGPIQLPIERFVKIEEL